MYFVDLNSDLGESFGSYKLGNDEQVLNYVSSVNIACGFHAGDPVVMEKTVLSAIERSVAIGAHPGYPDLMGFGRRKMQLDASEARAYMIYQIGALKAFVEASGGKLVHVKPHGALYNMAAVDEHLAETLAKAVYDVDRELAFVGLSNSLMVKAAETVGLRTVHEVFADRAYNSDGTLVARQVEGALIKDIEVCVSRVLKMVKDRRVTAIDGTEIGIRADSVCIHGDSETALIFARTLRERLEAEGIIIKPLEKGC